MERFLVTGISVSNRYPVAQGKVPHVCHEDNFETMKGVITAFFKSEGFDIGETANPIRKIGDTYAVLVKKQDDDSDDAYDLWNVMVEMDLTLPAVANGSISYPKDDDGIMPW